MGQKFPKYCKEGFYCDGMNMLPCPPGRSSQNKQDLGCVKCDRGKFMSDVAATSCMPCLPGTYAEGLGRRACMRCPKDTFRVEAGATSSSDCQLCTAKVGSNMQTLSLEHGSHTPEDCKCKGNACSKCTSVQACPASNSKTSPLNAA